MLHKHCVYTRRKLRGEYGTNLFSEDFGTLMVKLNNTVAVMKRHPTV